MMEWAAHGEGDQRAGTEGSHIIAQKFHPLRQHGCKSYPAPPKSIGVNRVTGKNRNGADELQPPSNGKKDGKTRRPNETLRATNNKTTTVRQNPAGRDEARRRGEEAQIREEQQRRTQRNGRNS